MNNAPDYDYDGIIEDAQAQMRRDALAYHQEMQAQYEREMLLNEISEDIVGCPFHIIDDILDDEVAAHYIKLVNNTYEQLLTFKS
tara:strand:+ start:443 stop:697 length:255 start_codon:yes stop_codon:yes gene_type:complete